MKSLLTLFVILCLLPAAPSSGKATTGGQDLLLFYSSDVAGETEPCG